MLKLTIIIATYNAGKCLPRALDSIIKLDVPNWECLIVDGASKDNTLSVVADYELKCSNIRHISEPDKGIYDAFNKGWQNAKGDWIFYLGADDEILQDGFKEICNYLEVDDNVAIVSGGVNRIRKDGSVKSFYTNGFIGSHQSMLTRKSVIQTLNGFDLNYKILADYDLIKRIEANNYKIVNCHSLLANFYAGGTADSINNSFKVFKEKYRILKTNRVCMFPFVRSFTDCVKTFIGNIIHS